MLSVRCDDEELPVAFFSCNPLPQELNYVAAELEGWQLLTLKDFVGCNADFDIANHNHSYKMYI